MNNKVFTPIGCPKMEVAVQTSIDGYGPRLYRTPDGKSYPSITTVQSIMNVEVLDKWRKRVGDAVANHESQWGKDRGDALHEYVEKYLKNGDLKGAPLIIRMMIEELKPYLNNIDNIQCQETALFSDFFEIGGRCDTIGDYSNILSVVDFKGSGKPKRRDWIENYFQQASFYAYAFYERTGIKIPQVVILIATEKGNPQEFIESPWKWWKSLKKVREEYRKLKGI